MFSRFLKDTGGNVAGMVAVAAIALVGAAGAAIDIGGATNLRSNYQDMADAAVLAAARSRTKKEADMHKIALKTVKLLNDTGTKPTVSTKLSEDKKFLMVQVDGDYSNHFMGIFGNKKVDVKTFAETVIEVNENAEIVLVLDTTRSMNYDGRLASLKTATNKFIDVIEGVDADDRVRISIVPFGQYVNVGTDQRGKDWLDVPADWVETFPTTCSMQRGPQTGQTCSPGVTQPRPAQPAQPAQAATSDTYGTCTDDGVSYRCKKSSGRPARPYKPAVPADPGGQPTTNCTPTYGPDVRVCNTPAPKHHTWNGCVGSRRNNANVDKDYTNGEAKVPGFLNLQCGDSILPLTSDFAAVRRKVDNLKTHGETYSAQGLIWGHRLIDFGDPFPMTRLSPNGEPPRRIVIFMTDGYNTRSRSGEMHDGTDRAEADRTSRRICKTMHDTDDIEVYSVSFKVADTQARRLVKDCASKPEMYYKADNAKKLNEAFEDIAFSLLTPRLTG